MTFSSSLLSAGFCRKAVAPAFQGPFTIELRIACGQDNYGNRRERGALLQTIEHNEAVPGGDTNIDDDEVGAPLFGHGGGGKTIRRIRCVGVVGAPAEAHPTP